ncbi:MAG: aldehyde dehydrogenase family protein [Cohaesibacteraceae bacterium]|nr:aldehyde dehydrogenase family protein [Cohaesibacteraceae bacterium]MBL4877070.1 aldehyde dehydrogenase family protein [Cohaesibacteraceae bacterium]
MQNAAHYYNGTFENDLGDNFGRIVNPSTEKMLGYFPCGLPSLIDRTVINARNVFEQSWKFVLCKERLGYLERLVGLIEEHRDEFANVISLEMGSPLEFSKSSQVGTALNHLRTTIRAANQPFDMHNSTVSLEGRIRFEPLGVAGIITPWNWPLNQVILKVAAAIAAGCTIVHKPSEMTALSSTFLARLIHESGLPAGVYNCIHGSGSQTGAALANHTELSVVSFTGSTNAGRKIAIAAAGNLIPSVMELGGKSPNLLFEDCDVFLAVKQGVAHAFRNAGQSCNAASRMLVGRQIYDDSIMAAKLEAAAFLPGDPLDRDTTLGPVISKTQFDRVQNLIQSGIDDGARLVCGGLGMPDGISEGYFVRPTIFADVTPAMRIWQEEIFGPVLTMTAFNNPDHAIELANNTAYGLSAYIQTADRRQAEIVSRQLDVGMVQVNGTSRAAGAPFGGVKHSGYGREGGLWGIRGFQSVKSISGVGVPPS